MNSAQTPIAPQPVAEVLSIYELRLVLIEHVRAGTIPRAEYDSLFEVLCATHTQLRWHRDDVTRAVQLVASLVKRLPAL